MRARQIAADCEFPRARGLVPHPGARAFAGLIRAARALCDDPLEPLSTRLGDEVTRATLERLGDAQGIPGARERATQKLAAGAQRQGAQRRTTKDGEVEGVGEHRGGGRHLLEQVEGRKTALIERDDFAIHHESAGIVRSALAMWGNRAVSG